MTDTLISETRHEVKYSAATKVAPLKVEEGISFNGFPTVRLSEPSGVISMTIDARMFPMLKPGDMVVATLSFVLGELVSLTPTLRSN